MRGCDEGNMRRKGFSNRGSSNTLLILLFGIMVLVLLALIVKQASDGSRTKKEAETNNGGGFKEIHIVATITPEPIEYIDFDLDKLAITGRDVKDGKEHTDTAVGADRAEDTVDTGRNTEMPEGIGEYDTGDGARPESDASTAVGSEEMPVGYEPPTGGHPEEPVGLEDGEKSTDTVPEHGEGNLPELLESGDDEARLQGSVDEYEQPIVDERAEQEYADSTGTEYTDDGDTDNPVLTYLGTFTATAYCACPICTGAYSTGYTASGTLATEGRTVACNILPFGTQIYIEGYGYYTVEDTGWSPYGDAWLDIFYSSHDSALAFGVRNVEVYLVN